MIRNFWKLMEAISIALDKKSRLQHKDPFDWSTIVPKQLYEKNY